MASSPLQALQAFGLNERQAAVYLALRALGASSALELSRHTGIPRVSIYSCLDELIRLGIASSSRRNRRLRFQGHEPSMLLELLRQRSALFDDALPLLIRLGRSDSQEFAFRSFEGQEQSRQGQREFFDLLVAEKIKQVRSFSHPDLIRTFPKFVPSMIQQRRQHGIHTQLLVPGRERSRLPASFRGASREVRILPERFPFNCTCAIGGANILFVMTKTKEPTAVLVRSGQVSELLTACFSALWELSAAER